MLQVSPYVICAFIFNALLLVVYFVKRSIRTVENKIYDVMVITSFFGTIIAFLTSLVVSEYETIQRAFLIIPRIYLLYLLVWGTAFTLYVIAVSILKKDTENKQWIKIKAFIISISSIVAILSLILPMDFVRSNSVVYTTGISVKIVYYLTFAYGVIMLTFILINIKNVINKKYIPVVSFLIFGLIVIYIQYRYPSLLLITLLITFNTILMYFTIENPDVKTIKELKFAKESAEKANRAKSDFLSSMSHEIRTPLNAIVGCTEILKDESLSKEGKSFLNDLEIASNSLLETVGGILDMSIIESGNLELTEVDYNPKEMFNELINLLKVKLNNKPVSIIEKYSNNIPDSIYGDKNKVKQIVSNLLTNAIKYTFEGEINFIVESIKEKEMFILKVIVKDTGKGIDENMMSRLFQKFQRDEEVLNGNIQGTGLGLSITKSLIELMKGEIKVESKVDKGTTFTVLIPQHKSIDENNIERNKK